MACVTLKRPLEWVDPSMSANSEPSGSSSPTSMIISNSPPHPGARSPKRLCLQGFTSPSYSSAYHSNAYHSQTSVSSGNNFHSIKPISSSEIVNQIRDEVYRLRLIRRPKHSKVVESSHVSSAGNKSPSPSVSSMNSSPSSSPKHEFGTDADMFQMFKKQKTFQLVNPDSLSKNASISALKPTSRVENKLSDTPMFSFNQVLMIFERLFREKEDELRKQYEELLSKRLSDQYDQFVKFNTDQMQSYDRNNLPSYLS